MGRPLTGSIRVSPSGRFEASIPSAKGSAQRVVATFDTQAQAQTWLDQAAAQVNAEQVVVAPCASLRVSWFSKLCSDWHQRHHLIEQQGQPERAEAVLIHIRRHLLPYFEPRWASPSDVDYDACTKFMQFLAGRRDSNDLLAVGNPAVKTSSISPYYQGEIIRTLSAVLDEGMKKGIVATNPAKKLRTVKPLNGKAKKKSTSTKKKATNSAGVYTLSEYRSFAAQLHPIHQLAMWLQRVVGLRVGEVYGIRVGDVIRDGAYGIYHVAAQGGRKFTWWDENGNAKSATRVNRTKTEESDRIVIFPPALMDLINLVVNAYHVGLDGETNDDAALVPGLKKIDVGSDAYRSALRAAGLVHGKKLSTHNARHSFISDLTNKTSISEERARLMVGHKAGEDTHARVYVHQSPDFGPAKQACDEVQALIVAEIATLIQPTFKRPVFARSHPMYAVRSRSEEVLTAAGVYTHDANMLSTEEVAVLIGRNERVTRNLCKDGEITAAKTRGAAGIERWVVARCAVDAFLARYSGLRSVKEVAVDLELSYHQAYELAKRLQVLGDHDTATGMVLVADGAVDAMRAELERIACLRQRSMTLSEAELALRRRRSTLAGWIGTRLELDPQVDGAGCKYVTRASVERAAAELAALPKRKRNLPGRP